MSDVLADLTPPSLAVAVRTNLHAFFRLLARAASAELLEGPAAARWHTPVAHPWFNGVLAKQPPAEGADQEARDAIAQFEARGVRSFTWWLKPGLDTEAWARVLVPLGFHYDDGTPGMAVELAALPAPVPPVGLTIRTVESLDDLRSWTRTFGIGYGLPDELVGPYFELLAGVGLDLPVRHYLGELDGVPAATSTLLLAAGAAGVYNVATVPDARGRGLGAALSLEPLREAQALGYRAGVLQSSDMGVGVYRRLGFRTVCAIDHFFWKRARVSE